MPLQVSPNRRFLVHDDGTPFFYLADTAWELFHRLTREEADFYLQTRAAQGFTVIQAVALAEYGGLTVPNAEGGLPLHENDPAQPQKLYFRHVDWIVNRAAELGLYIGMLPSWGDKVNQKWGEGPEIFTPDNAFAFGKFLGRRYQDKPLIWIIGGDRVPENDTHYETWRLMVNGLRMGDGGTHLMTFHPMGGQSSSSYFHSADWLDFNMMQTGHSRNSANYDKIAHDYALSPAKPCLDGEPGYEDHPESFDPKNGYLNDYDARKAAYWAVFAGACGHTYGCHDIWQFLDTSRFPAVTSARTPWREALQLPGANQMRHVRALIESRPFLSRIPDQSLLVSDAGTGGDHVQATRDADGSYAFVYSAAGLPFTLDTAMLSGATLAAWWFDPRTGHVRSLDRFPRIPSQTFTPPTEENGSGWVLVLDDAARNFPPPGTMTA
jgi:hypothetical protein